MLSAEEDMKKMFTAALGLALWSGAVNAVPGEEAFIFEERGGGRVEAYRGSIEVHENRNNPESRLIPVTYVRFPAMGQRKGSPIIYLAGGPGGSGVQTAKYRRFKMFMAMRAYGDVIALDQRGTGESNMVPECTSSKIIPPTKRISDEEYVALERAAFEECLVSWKADGVDVAGYNTVENARDIDALRAHLGAEKVVLWGTSYGSHLAFAALKEMGDRIDRVILSSAEGLDQTVKLPALTDRYFDRLQAVARKQPETNAIYSDIKGLMRRVHAKLEAEPVLLHVKLKNGDTVDYLFQRRDMQRLASALVSDPWGVKRLLALYLAIDKGIVAPFEEMLGRWFIPGEPIRLDAMSNLMDIASGMSEERRKLVKEQAKGALLGAWLNFTYHYDGVAPELDLGDAFRTGPASDVPVLLFSGTLDGRTYLEGQDAATQGLTNLTHVIVENAGHNLFMSSDKVQDAINHFMEGKPPPESMITLEAPNLLPPAH